jgi:hypothetical protein
MNPFGAIAERPRATNAVAKTDQHRAIAEVQAAMMIARMNPRDPIAATDRILNACSRATLADAAIYHYARGGQDVSGPSIRLAEAMAQQWGNIKTSVRELENSDGVSVVQAIAWDLETGYQVDKVFHVAHERHTKNGIKKLTDPRDIYEVVANQGARRLRACILAVIPGDVIEAAVKQCEVTMRAKAEVTPESLQKLLEAFAPWGVTKEQIEKRIQRRLDAIQPAQVVMLKKIYASLRDGMSAPEEWFDAAESAPLTSQVKRKSDAAHTPAPIPGPPIDEDVPTGFDETKTSPQEPPASSVTAQEMLLMIGDAENVETLDHLKGVAVFYEEGEKWKAQVDAVQKAFGDRLRALTKRK